MTRIVAARSRIAQPGSVQLRSYPTEVQRSSAPEVLRAIGFSKPDAQRSYRSYFGRNISLDGIERALLASYRGNMMPLTDIGRETLNMDPHLASVVNKRVGALAGLPWEVHPASGHGVDPVKALFYAAVVREQLLNLRNFRASLKRLAWALYDGRAALEKQWLPISNGMALGPHKVTMALSSLEWIHPRRLSFGRFRELHVVDESSGVAGNFADYGLRLSALPFKFVTWLPQLFGEYPEREGLAPRCLYWSFFKRFGARERMILLELFGKPWRIVTVDPDSPASDSDLRDADEVADALGSSYTARLPRGVNLTVSQPQKTAGAVHDDVIKESDRQISKLVLGQTGTTDEMKGGMNNSQASVMQDEQLGLLQGDAREFQEVVEDQVTDEIIALNFGEAEVIHAPTFALRADLPPNRLEELERTERALKAGLALAAQEVYQVSGFRQPDVGEVVIRMEQPRTEPNSPVAPAPRPVFIYPQGTSPAVGEQQPTPPTAAIGPGAAPAPASSAGAGSAEKTITVNEDRAARGLPPLTLPGTDELDPDGELTIADFEAKRGVRIPELAPPDPEPDPVDPEEDDLGADPEGDDGEDSEAKQRPALKGPVGIAASVQLTIRHEGSKWVVYSQNGKPLGTYDTKADAEERLRQVEYFKHQKAAANFASADVVLLAVGRFADEAASHSAAVAVLGAQQRATQMLRWMAEPCAHGVALDDARQPETEHGTPDDLIGRGISEGRRAVAKMADRIADAVRGKTQPGEIFRAVELVRRKLDAHPLARGCERRMVQALALGALDASLLDEVKAASADGTPPPKTPFSKSPYESALRHFRTKNVMRKAAFAQLEARAKQRAFTVAGLAADDMVATVHDELVQQVAKGADLREFATTVKDRLKEAGWLPRAEVLGNGQTVMNAWHTDNVFRTNVLGAYNAGRAAQMSEPEVVRRRPVWQIRGIDDSTTRKNHLKAHGLKLLASDPFWQRAYPPFSWNCRCRVVSLSGDHVNDVVDGSTITYLPDEGFTSGIGTALL